MATHGKAKLQTLMYQLSFVMMTEFMSLLVTADLDILIRMTLETIGLQTQQEQEKFMVFIDQLQPNYL